MDRYRATGQRLLLALDGVEHFPREISTVRDAQRVLMGTAPPIPTRRLRRFWSVPDETKSSPDLRSSSFPRTVMRNKTVKSTPRGVGWSERGRAMRPGTSRFSVTICTAMSRIAAICWRVDSSSFWFDSWENLIDFMLKGWSPRKQSKNPPEAKRLRSLPVTA